MDKTVAQGSTAAKTNAAFLKDEMREILDFLNKQLFNQIPSVSAIAGIVAGAWVMSTFTASPIKGALAELGLIDGGTRVVSSWTYKFMAVALPILATSITAYAVHKGLFAFREMQIEVFQARAGRLTDNEKKRLEARLAALELARAESILSWSEYRAKMVNVYQQFVGSGETRIDRLIMKKMGSKIQ